MSCKSDQACFAGHGADVKCVHWHPQKGLIVSGSKDNQQPVKLWDPKTGQSLATLWVNVTYTMEKLLFHNKILNFCCRLKYLYRYFLKSKKCFFARCLYVCGVSGQDQLVFLRNFVPQTIFLYSYIKNVVTILISFKIQIV